MSDRLALLERAQQGDGSAEAQLLTENAGLIWSIVRRYTAAAWKRTTCISWDV